MIDRERTMNFALMLEKHMIPPDEWDTCGAPITLLGPAKRESDNGYPTGIAYHPEYGWFGLATGQGPFVWWYDMTHEEFEKLVNNFWFGKTG